jgi:putative ABC transport system permease protein
VRRLRALLRTLFQGQRLDRALDEELQSALDLLAADHEARGLSPGAARRAARMELAASQVAEDVRRARAGHVLVTFVRDVRFGWRALRRSPGFSVVAFLTLALSLAASLATFSVVHGVLWRELPYPDSERLVVIEADLHAKVGVGPASGELLEIAARSRSLTSLATANGVDTSLDIDGELLHVPAASVSDDLLPLLGAVPMTLGRSLAVSQDAGRTTVRGAVISYRLWRDELSRDPNVIGRHISANDIDVKIVGVLPEAWRPYLPAANGLAEEADVWFPAQIDQSRSDHAFPVLAALKPRTTIEGVQAELDTFARQFVAERPGAYPNGILRYRVTPLRLILTKGVRPALVALAVAVGLLLVIAWINVANLLIARGQARGRELAVRCALGASRARVACQLFTECGVLAGISGAAGLALAYACVRAFGAVVPHQLPRQATITLDAAVAAVAIGLTALTMIVLGVMPALAAGRSEVAPLRSGRGDIGTPRRRLQRSLLVAEVALTVTSLMAAGLMVRTFVNLTSAPLGFDPADITVARAPMSGRLMPDPARRYAVFRDAVDRVRVLPGVTAVSGASPLPFTPIPSTPRLFLPGAQTDSGTAVMQVTLPDYLRVAGIRLLAGRDFTDADVTERHRVIVVDERIARELWQGQAIGKRLHLRNPKTVALEVIGVTTPVRMRGVRDDVTPTVFVPYWFHPIDVALVVKTRPDVAIAAPLRAAMETIGTGRAVHGIEPLADMVGRSIRDVRLAMSVGGLFAVATLVLAAIGLYGTLAYLIARRQREFGVRLAMGATRVDLVRLVTMEGLILTAIGTCLGLAGGFGAGQVIGDVLFGVQPADAATSMIVAATVMITALIAIGHPAWRAGRTDVNSVLRTE